MTTYIHYGSDHFYPEFFIPVRNGDWRPKPADGTDLWASRVDDEYGWEAWCRENPLAIPVLHGGLHEKCFLAALGVVVLNHDGVGGLGAPHCSITEGELCHSICFPSFCLSLGPCAWGLFFVHSIVCTRGANKRNFINVPKSLVNHKRFAAIRADPDFIHAVFLTT